MAITRDDVMWRTNHIWAEESVPYSMEQVHYPDGYRADCSGYTSMCWMLPTPGGSTVTLVDDGYIYEIPEDWLSPGDAVGNCGPGTGGAYGHIQLFECWTDEGYYVWEQTGGGWGPHRNFYYGAPSWNGYQAWRFFDIAEEGAGMSEREAQLAASYATTGSDENGNVDCPEAWSIVNYSNRSVEERINTKLAEISNSVAKLASLVESRGGRPPRPPRPHAGGQGNPREIPPPPEDGDSTVDTPA